MICLGVGLCLTFILAIRIRLQIPIMVLFLISVLGFVAFLYTAPRETLCLTAYSAFNLLLFPFWFTLIFNIPPITKLDGLPGMGETLGFLQRQLVLIFLLHQLCNWPVRNVMKGSRSFMCWILGYLWTLGNVWYPFIWGLGVSYSPK